MYRLFIAGVFLLCLVLPGRSLAQEAPEFSVFVDAKEVLLSSYFEVSFTLRNGEGSDFRPPSFRDFVVVSGPSRSVSTTIVNGQVSRQISFSYNLKPRREGTFTIGQASIEVTGKTLTTSPVSIRVIKGRSGAVDREDQFFIRAEPSVTEAYIGRQISLDYKLYTTINIESYNVLEESDYPGFYAEDLKRYEGRVMREVINGVQYTTKTLKRVALFPQQAGTLVIDPLQLQLGILSEEKRRSNSFFFNRQIKRLLTQTEPVEIRVKPLPSPYPESFTGAVGDFALTSSLPKTTFTTDDVLSLKLRIEGNGDIKRVQAPPLIFPEGFEVYDPKVLEETTNETDGELRSVKVFEYLALPRVSGEYELKPAFSYFDSESGQYVTIDENQYRITVKPGARGSGPPVDIGQAGESASDIRFIKTDTRVYQPGRSFFGSGLFWFFTVTPFLLLCGMVVVRRQQAIKEGMDPAVIRRRQARNVAQKRLLLADQYRKNGESRAFYDEVSKAMLGYVGDKLQIPRSAMTKDAVREKLQQLLIPDELSDRFLSIIQTCEMALFAGKDDAEGMDAVYENAIEVLVAMEEHIK